MHVDLEAVGFGERDAAVLLVIGGGHIEKARAEIFVVRSGAGVGGVEIDVVFDHHERALREIGVDAAGGVGEDDGANAHAPHDADGKGDVLHRIALIEVHAALHRGDGHVSHFADDEFSGVADGGRDGKVRDLFVFNARGAGELVGKSA